MRIGIGQILVERRYAGYVGIIIFASCFLLLTFITACGRRADPVLVPSYEENKFKESTGGKIEGTESGEIMNQKGVTGAEEDKSIVPGAPAKVEAVYTGKSIVLTWYEVKHAGVVAYRIYRSSGSDFIMVGETVTPAFTDRDIKQGIKYGYRITAVGVSEGPPSEEIFVSTETE